MELLQCFSFQAPSVVSLTGSGGKTSLMNFLAKGYDRQRVLMSTTTKIRLPEEKDFDFFYDSGKIVCPGITLFGLPAEEGKLKSPDLKELRSVLPLFDLAFLEADGAKEKPLKGWESFEPVVIQETTDTIGVIPITACGETISERLVHRLPLFLNLGFENGQEVTPEILAKVSSRKNGLFRSAKGRKWLVLSQVKGKYELDLAEKVLQCLEPAFLSQLTAVIAADVHRNKGWVLWNR